MAVPCPAGGGSPQVALPDLRIWRTSNDEAIVVRVEGEVDSANVAALAEQLTAAAADATGVVVVELLGVTFFGSVGLTALLDCRRACEHRDVALRVVSGQGGARRTIELAGLTTVLDVYAELTRALRQR